MLNDSPNPGNQGTVAAKSTLDTTSHDGTREGKSSPSRPREALHASTPPRPPPQSQALEPKPEDAGDGDHQPTRRSHLTRHARLHNPADREPNQETHPVLRDLLPRLLPVPRRRNPGGTHHTAPQTAPSPRLHLARRPRQAGLEAQQAPAAPDPPTAPEERGWSAATLPRRQASPGTEPIHLDA